MNSPKLRQSKALRIRAFTLLGVYAGVFQLWSCSTTETKTDPAPSISPPQYVQVPHPLGFDLGDLEAMFAAQGAPKRDTLKDCDTDYRKLEKVTKHPDELRKGARELVRNDPVTYHWCFYAKILGLEERLKNTSFIEERQKALLETYAFLTPIARGYMIEYKDSRYLRWAVRHYRGVSEWVFYRKLDQSEQMTQLLVEVNNPFGLWRDTSGERSVLEKYNLAKPREGEKANRKPIFPRDENSPTEAAPLMPPAAPTAKDAKTSERLPAAATHTPVAAVPQELLPTPADMVPDAGSMMPEPVPPPPPPTLAEPN